jgi:hypothetical protein
MQREVKFQIQLTSRIRSKKRTDLWYESGAQMGTSDGKTVGQKYAATGPLSDRRKKGRRVVFFIVLKNRVEGKV